jgi:hypothetical protein
MGGRRCIDCIQAPVMKCGRCTATRCARHALEPGRRCDSCEREWADEADTRRNAKLIFAPPLALLTGGLLFGLLMPLLGALGAAVLCIVAVFLAAGTGVGTCMLVERSSRAVFLRERAGALPPARLLPSPRHR